jgi:hypothetical protein
MKFLALIRMDNVPERLFLDKFFDEKRGQKVRLKQLRLAYEKEFQSKPALRIESIEVWDSEKLWESHVPICVEKGEISLIHM